MNAAQEIDAEGGNEPVKHKEKILHQPLKSLVFLVKEGIVHRANVSLCQRQHMCLVLQHQGCLDELLLCTATPHLIEVNAEEGANAQLVQFTAPYRNM